MLITLLISNLLTIANVWDYYFITLQSQLQQWLTTRQQLTAFLTWRQAEGQAIRDVYRLPYFDFAVRQDRHCCVQGRHTF